MGPQRRRSKSGRPWMTVGFDGSTESIAALTWALQWAHDDELDVRVVLAAPDDTWLLPLREAVAECCPPAGVTVFPTIVHGDPVSVLVGESAHAQVLAVGSRSASPWAGLLAVSVAHGVASRSACPVIVVPPGNTDVTWSRGPVAVGIDGSPESIEAADFAFRRAQRWRVPVVALHVRTDGPTARKDARTAQRIVEALGERFPEVPADFRIVDGPAAASLAALSDVASLVVVGSRGRGEVTGLVLGSTSRELVRAARCPVAILRTQRVLGSAPG